jgi:hypothetical protein
MPGSMKQVTIPENTLLYRASDNVCSYTSKICNQKRRCSNTTKNGIYFSTYILQAIAISIEYGRDLELGIFTTKAPMTVYVGKYSFRNIHPERWSHNWPTEGIQENEDVSHFNSKMEPIITYNNISLVYPRFNIKDGMGELFLTKKEELDNIELIETYKIKVDVLKAFLKSEFFSKGIRFVPMDDINLYIRSGSIEPFFCSPVKADGGGGTKRKTRRKSKRLASAKRS